MTFPGTVLIARACRLAVVAHRSDRPCPWHRVSATRIRPVRRCLVVHDENSHQLLVARRVDLAPVGIDHHELRHRRLRRDRSERVAHARRNSAESRDQEQSHDQPSACPTIFAPPGRRRRDIERRPANIRRGGREPILEHDRDGVVRGCLMPITTGIELPATRRRDHHRFDLPPFSCPPVPMRTTSRRQRISPRMATRPSPSLANSSSKRPRRYRHRIDPA